MVTLHYWTKRTPGRIYVNGLTGQNRFTDKIYASPDASGGYVLYRFGGTQDMENEARAVLGSIGLTWAAILAKCDSADVPPLAPVEPRTDAQARAILEAAHIAHVAQAARVCGITFKNGLRKEEIINLILSRPALAPSVIDALRNIQNGQKPPVKADWLDDDDKPAPVQPVADIDLSDYCKRVELEAEAADIRAALSLAQKRIADLEKHAPIIVNLPGNPEPIKIDGLRHPQYVDLLNTLRLGLHCALIGGAGTGKTTASEQAAADLGLTYYKEKPFTYAHEVLGYIDQRGYHRTPTRDAVEHGGLILFDEADRSSAEALIALNAVLDTSAFVAFPDGLIRKHSQFVAVYAGNTDGSGATMQFASAQRQDGSTLDRLVTFHWDVDPRIEEQMARGHSDWLAAVRAIREFVSKRGIQDVLGTPRATKHGALMIEGGISRAMVLERTCKRGALVECWRDVIALPAVSAFLKG